jgi:hypothetical protein
VPLTGLAVSEASRLGRAAATVNATHRVQNAKGVYGLRDLSSRSDLTCL